MADHQIDHDDEVDTEVPEFLSASREATFNALQDLLDSGKTKAEAYSELASRFRPRRIGRVFDEDGKPVWRRENGEGEFVDPITEEEEWHLEHMFQMRQAKMGEVANNG